MSEELTRLMHVIPNDDCNCDLKRAEIARWYNVYGNKVFYNIDKENSYKVMSVLAMLIIDIRFWSDDIKLNNLTLGEELLQRINVEQINHNLISQLYDLSCILCLEGYVRELFCKLDHYNKNWTTERFVCGVLNSNKDSPLIKFWSHYINIVGIENPNPVILSSFKKLLSEYSQDLNVNNTDDLWQYGFECAKQDGSREALEFFWNKIHHRYSGEEKVKVFFDIGLHASSVCCHNKKNSFNLIEFSLKYLGIAKYKDFIVQDHKEEKWSHVISILVSNYSYNEAKKLIDSLDPKEVSDEDYDFLLVGDTLDSMHGIPYELRKLSFEFFKWLWEFEKFDNHKHNCLNGLDNILQSLLKLQELPISFGVTELILNSLSEEQAVQVFRFSPGRRLCSILYTQNERELLRNKIFKFFKDGDKFIGHVDALTLKTLKECKELEGFNIDEIFDLYIQGRAEDFIKLIEGKVDSGRSFFLLLKELADTTFGDMMNGKINLSQEISSQLDRMNLYSIAGRRAI